MRRSKAGIFTQPRLNFDVLCLVCNSLTEISDVLSFALTCSELTVPALQRRLKISSIHLSNDELVHSFHRFIFADEPARAQYIYGLKLPRANRLPLGEPPGSRLRPLQDPLMAILKAAVHLEYISFPTAIDLFPVLTAAANITSLRDLHIVFADFGGDCRWSPWKLLGTFRSPLRSLRIDSSNDSANEGFSVKLIHDYLASFSTTLEVLELHSIDIYASPSPLTTQFTALRSLTTHSVLNFDQSTMEVLLRLFPNLDDTLSLGFLGVMDGEHDLLGLRERSKEVQTARTWSGFDRVVCDVRLAFLMALQCPIRRMHITVLRFYGRGLLGPVIRDNCPRLLHLSLLFNNSLRDLDDLFPAASEEVNTLTHLIVFVDVEVRKVYGRPTSIPWAQFMDKLFGSMMHLRLTHLRVVFRYTVWHEATTGPSAIQARDAMYTAHETDLHAVATRVFDAMPTIQYVLLATCGHTYQCLPRNEAPPGATETVNKWHASKAWRAPDSPITKGHSKAKASPVALSREAAEKIVAQEELHSSCDEEVCTFTSNILANYSS
ncbi:hypothetical protein GSI_05816 [Ganoderma sinense ZZ0214-1]|uniref:F-box domain-containing protein n=1 Tax=Ganoderma sinense ZZ0214-1 TaxID=1077348 RepID=A0A2G8SBI6_9APHY|nr:hypothetical protein GSI_05816 [Ganoderma sinense ZZ0214-1]